MMNKYPHRFSNQKGLTLIELMVATAISLILITGVIQIFVGNKKTYQVQEAVSRLQENARFAAHLLTTDIRNADMWGCHGDISNINDDDITNKITNKEGIEGKDGSTDTLTIRGAYESGVPLTARATLPGNVNVFNNPFETGDIILISDCEQGAITKVTGAASSGPLTTSGGNGAYDTDALVWQPREITYFIAQGKSGLPGLRRREKNYTTGNIDDANNPSSQEVVEGVEDFQVLYGIDTDAAQDGSANRYVTATDVANNNWEARIVSARVNMTLISLADNLTTTVKNGDRRIRNDFSTTIVLRNRSI